MVDYPYGLSSECSSAETDYDRQFAAMGGRREQQHARTPREILVARIGVGLVIAIALGVVIASTVKAW